MEDDVIIQQRLAEQARQLLVNHVPKSSRQRTAKLRELVYLLDAAEAGQDVLLAKLAYDPEKDAPADTMARLRHHLGARLPEPISTAADIGHGIYLLGRGTR